MMTIRCNWPDLRTWLGWGREAREARVQIDDLQRLSEILRKAEEFDKRAREATIETRTGLQIGDEVILDAGLFPKRGRIIDAVVVNGIETLNIPRCRQVKIAS